MEEVATESSDNQHSDGEFEKIQYPPPGEDESSVAVKDSGVSDALECQASSSSSQGPVDGGQKARKTKSQLESSADTRENIEKTNCWTTHLDPSVLDLIYWRDVKKTAVVFSISLLILAIFAFLPLLSIISYTSLLILTGTFAIRLYGNIVCYIKKSKEPHMLNKYLEKDINFPADCVHKFADQLVANVSKVIDDIRKLFLVERFLDSIKFALLLWLLTFIGSWFSGFAVLAIGDIVLFTIPKFYQVYQKQIDEYLRLANAKLETLEKTILEKIQRKRKEE